ncbi:MAG: SMP-30/gluconolactonase/LRE family protein [Pseudomonadota bacterium]
MRLTAKLWTRLPSNLHYRGDPTAWTQLTRPGLHLHSFLEGACFDEDGALWLVDVPHGRLLRTDGSQWDVQYQYDGEPHGLARAPGQSRWIVSDHRHGLLEWNGAAHRVICDAYQGAPFLGLNHVIMTSSGDVWFSDCGRSSHADPSGALYRYGGDGSIERICGGIAYPNGLALSEDGEQLFLAVTRANQVWTMQTAPVPHGSPMIGTFLNLSGGLGPDGLSVSGTGLLAVAQARAGCVWVFDAFGERVATIQVTGGTWTTDCVFGPDGQLYIIEAQQGAVHRCDLSGLES